MVGCPGGLDAVAGEVDGAELGVQIEVHHRLRSGRLLGQNHLAGGGHRGPVDPLEIAQTPNHPSSFLPTASAGETGRLADDRLAGKKFFYPIRQPSLIFNL